jgi:hypothetical protein
MQPNTSVCREFEERAINAAVISSLVKQQKEGVPRDRMRVTVSDIEKQLSRALTVEDIRRRIRRRFSF